MSTNKILTEITKMHQQNIQSGFYILDATDHFKYDILSALAAFYALPQQHSDISILSEFLSPKYSEIYMKLNMTRKEQLVQAAAIIVAELERMELDQENLLCFLKYLP